jgi:hypothetical protein
MSSLDDVLGKLSLEEKLEVRRRVRVGSLNLQEGDRVAARYRLRGSYIHEGLEDEGEDCRIPYNVPAGTRGHIVRVRQYVCPFPYVVIFDNHVEISVEQGNVERVAD